MNPFRPFAVFHRFMMRSIRAHRAEALGLAALVVVVVGGMTLWLGLLRHRFLPKNWGVVEQGLIYRSGQIDSAILEPVLREHHILAVIDVSGDSGRSDEDEELEIVARMGIEKFTVPGLAGDGVGPLDSYIRAFTKLVAERATGRPVLVHCRAGSERTGALISLYRVLIQHWTPKQAYAEYLRYRHRPPTSHVLWTYLNANLPAFVAGVVATGALPEAPFPLPHLGPELEQTADR